MCAQPKRALIFVNGSLPDPQKVRFLLEPDDWLVAVDGGWYYLKALGLRPHLLIGDLDSVAAEDVAALEAQGVEIRRFPVHKDETDLELALLAVRAAGVTTLRVAAALGGRLDQTLANLFLLLLPELEDCLLAPVGETPVELEQLAPDFSFCYRTSESLPGRLRIVAVDTQNNLLDLDFITWEVP